jgi:hypothetical protein
MGKPVVSTALPELEPYADISYIARSAEDFLPQVEAALREKENPESERVSQRMQVALDNSWQQRAAQIDQIIEHQLNVGTSTTMLNGNQEESCAY